MHESPKSPASSGRSPVFQTTHWSLVMQAAGEGSSTALEQLCGTYWYPLYAFVRRQGYGPHDAQDLTQGFFELFLAKHYLKDVNREKGRFRSFLLASLKHFMANEWKKANRQKRGGSGATISFDAMEAEERFRHEPFVEATAEQVYDRGWAQAILEAVMQRLREEYEQTGRGDRFAALRVLLFTEPPVGEYARLAEAWQVTESAVRSSVQRARQRYAVLFHEEIAHTLSDPRDAEGEIAYLMGALV